MAKRKAEKYSEVLAQQELKRKFDKLTDYLKTCPNCSDKALNVAVDCILYYPINGGERLGENMLDNRWLVCGNCAADSNDDKDLKERWKIIRELEL